MRKTIGDVRMNFLVNLIKQKQEVIEAMTKKCWVNLDKLEKTYSTLRAAKMPLISYGAFETKGSSTTLMLFRLLFNLLMLLSKVKKKRGQTARLEFYTFLKKSRIRKF